MKILIVGKGHLGSYITNFYRNLSHIIYQWKDNMDNLNSDILKPYDVVINTAGKTDLAWCENNPQETYQNNIIAPLNLFRRCQKLGLFCIHLSSGCVWDGPFNQDNKPFEPNNPISPACVYSWSKALCDCALLREAKDDCLILRPRQVYSPIHSTRNTIDKLIKYKDLLDTPNSMTSADTIIKTIDVMLKTRTINNFSSIINVYDKGYSSPYQVAKLLYEAGLRDEPGVLDKTKLDQWHKPKRVDTVLYDRFFEIMVNPPNVQDELKRVIHEYIKNA